MYVGIYVDTNFTDLDNNTGTSQRCHEEQPRMRIEQLQIRIRSSSCSSWKAIRLAQIARRANVSGSLRIATIPHADEIV